MLSSKIHHFYCLFRSLKEALESLTHPLPTKTKILFRLPVYITKTDKFPCAFMQREGVEGLRPGDKLTEQEHVHVASCYMCSINHSV